MHDIFNKQLVDKKNGAIDAGDLTFQNFRQKQKVSFELSVEYIFEMYTKYISVPHVSFPL